MISLSFLRPPSNPTSTYFGASKKTFPDPDGSSFFPALLKVSGHECEIAMQESFYIIDMFEKNWGINHFPKCPSYFFFYLP